MDARLGLEAEEAREAEARSSSDGAVPFPTTLSS